MSKTTAVKSEMVRVTPTRAKQMLNKNLRNRNLREATVAQYARDMAAGNWPFNGESIKFAEDGTLLDGQHRLAAIVRSNVPVLMLVITGLPQSAQETVDVGRKRTASDTLLLRGETKSPVLGAILRRAVLWDRGDRKFRDSTSIAELSDMLEKYPEIRRSAEIAARTHYAFRYLPTSSLGLSHHLITRVAPDEAPWFFQRISDGAELPVGHPVLTLRDRAMRDVDQGRRANDVRAVAYIARAWNAVRRGENLSRLVHPADVPIPDFQ